MMRGLFKQFLFCVLGCYGVFVSADEVSVSRESVRAAVVDLMETFGSRYPDGRTFLKQLEQATPDELPQLQRAALLANPLVSEHPLLFVVRKQYAADHHNTATLFQTGEINAQKYAPPGVLKIFYPATQQVKTLFDPGPTGLARDPDVSFDGKRIVFSMRRSPTDDYHIYEIHADGSGLRALTSAAEVADIDPVYLPSDEIVFSSTREPKFCMCNRHIMANLFKMDADGANIHQIGKSTLFEGHASVMPDGRILYDRWEYVDRNFGNAQGLWTVNPDGTNHAIYWGNNTAVPDGVIDARIIPGTSLCLCIFGSCHDRPWGALAIVDRRKGVDGRDPVVQTWPVKAKDLVHEKEQSRNPFDTFKRVRPRYEDPFPLNKNYFLVSRSTGKGSQMGLYLVDRFGNEVLLHAEQPGCFDPMPLAPRSRPAVTPPSRNFSSATGFFYVQDVYVGTHMKGVKRGTIKALRIVESPEKRNWSVRSWEGQGAQAPAMNWHGFENKRILGTVPVEADGSAYFEVPVDRFVYFQALDAEGMMVQTMRSGTQVQPGETQGCIGCHEDRIKDAPPVRSPQALRRAPSPLHAWQEKSARTLSYVRDIQPIFDTHCIRCHDYGKMGSKKLILAGDRSLSFNASYMDLWSKGLLACVGGGLAPIQPAYSWGSHASRLIKKLKRGHNRVKLSADEMQRLVTWVDLNAPYYPVYESAYPSNDFGRSPLSPSQVGQLEKLTGVKMVRTQRDHRGAQVSFDRPEKSRCLLQLDPASKEYAQALEIITLGQQKLQQTPRADMIDFVPSTSNLKRLEKYKQRQQIEQRNRAAIRTGKKVYD